MGRPIGSKNTIQAIPSCHPDRKYFCKGLCKKCYERDYYSKTRETQLAKRQEPERKRRARNRWLIRMFAISIEQYEELLASQGGRCAVCLTDKPMGKGDFHVDHDHATEKLRELLCMPCNAILGIVKDSVPRLEALILYLRKHNANI